MTWPTISPDKITVDREDRQRQDLSDREGLRASIARNGIIQPIILDENFKLVAGERRLLCAIELGLLEVPYRALSELSDEEAQIIELEENIKRKPLTWTEEVKAIARFHDLMLQQDPDWTRSDTAQALSMSQPSVSQYLLIHEHFQNPLVGEADKLSTALNAATRIKERKQASSSRELENAIENVIAPKSTVLPSDAPVPAVPEEPKAKPAPAFIINDSFLTWTETYDGPAFNLIHCDFPYGVNIGDKVRGQASAKSTGYYEDTPDVYFNLLEHLCSLPPSFISPSCHLIFWFSMNFYQETYDKLTEAGWNVLKHPLIWHKSDGAGIIPDPNRQPRRTYETALFAARGDRKIVRAVHNSISSPTTRLIHTSEKPLPVLNHFLRMVTDETTVLLDPTAGSGNAVRASYTLGARLSIGLELDRDFATAAKENVKAGIAEAASGD